MADMDKKRTMEELSKEELHEKIESDKKQAKRSTVFAITALIAIIVLCIAWFVANNLVKGTPSSISAKNSHLFELASVGDTKQDDKGLQLSEGREEIKDKYYDCEEGKWVNSSQDYHVGIADLAWYANGQQMMYPGESGKLEFYIIPTELGAHKKTAEVTLDLEAYSITVNDNKAKKSDDDRLQKLVNGHILLFQSLNNTDGYKGWLYTNGVNKLTVNAPEGGFQAGVPYKITVYWVWPKYFRNYVYNSRSTYGDLFTSVSSGDYTNLLSFVNSYPEYLFYPTDTIEKDKISNTMSDTELDKYSKYYDQADEYIGGKNCYVYINASVK